MHTSEKTNNTPEYLHERVFLGGYFTHLTNKSRYKILIHDNITAILQRLTQRPGLVADISNDLWPPLTKMNASFLTLKS